MIKKIFQLPPDFENRDSIILRDYLALERTQLANERTLMSYIRSSLYLMLGGIAFIQLQGFGQLKWIGYLSLFLSILFVGLGLFRFFHLRKRLSKFYADNRTPTQHKL
jgi:putative membrane protein